MNFAADDRLRSKGLARHSAGTSQFLHIDRWVLEVDVGGTRVAAARGKNGYQSGTPGRGSNGYPELIEEKGGRGMERGIRKVEESEITITIKMIKRFKRGKEESERKEDRPTNQTRGERDGRVDGGIRWRATDFRLINRDAYVHSLPWLITTTPGWASGVPARDQNDVTDRKKSPQ